MCVFFLFFFFERVRDQSRFWTSDGSAKSEWKWSVVSLPNPQHQKWLLHREICDILLFLLFFFLFFTKIMHYVLLCMCVSRKVPFCASCPAGKRSPSWMMLWRRILHCHRVCDRKIMLCLLRCDPMLDFWGMIAVDLCVKEEGSRAGGNTKKRVTPLRKITLPSYYTKLRLEVIAPKSHRDNRNRQVDRRDTEQGIPLPTVPPIATIVWHSETQAKSKPLVLLKETKGIECAGIHTLCTQPNSHAAVFPLLSLHSNLSWSHYGQENG